MNSFEETPLKVNTSFQDALMRGNEIHLVEAVKQNADELEKLLKESEIFKEFSDIVAESLRAFFTVLMQSWIDNGFVHPSQKLSIEQIIEKSFGDDFEEYVPQFAEPQEKVALVATIQQCYLKIYETFNALTTAAEWLLVFYNMEKGNSAKLVRYFPRIFNFYYQKLTDPQAENIYDLIDEIENKLFSEYIIFLKNLELQYRSNQPTIQKIEF